MSDPSGRSRHANEPPELTWFRRALDIPGFDYRPLMEVARPVAAGEIQPEIVYESTTWWPAKPRVCWPEGESPARSTVHAIEKLETGEAVVTALSTAFELP